MEKTRSKSSSDSASGVLRIGIPALLTIISTPSPPVASSTCSACCVPAPAGERSVSNVIGSFLRSPATRARSLVVLPLRITRAPAASKALALASPIPRVAPVTRAVFPSSSYIAFSLTIFLFNHHLN